MENGESWVSSPEWRPHLEKARETLSTVGLAALTPGQWFLNYYVDGRGLVTYKLLHMPVGEPSNKAIKRALFVLDYLPLARCGRQRPVTTEGRIIRIRGGRLRDDGVYDAQVVLDETGWPVPVPVAALKAYGLEVGDDATR